MRNLRVSVSRLSFHRVSPLRRVRTDLSIEVLVVLRSYVREHEFAQTLVFLGELHRIFPPLGNLDGQACGSLEEGSFPPGGTFRTVRLFVLDDAGLDFALDCG